MTALPVRTTGTPTRRRPAGCTRTTGLGIHQVPLETYRSCAVSVAELEDDGTAGETGGSGTGGARVRFCTGVDTRLLVGDLLAKLRRVAAG